MGNPPTQSRSDEPTALNHTKVTFLGVPTPPLPLPGGSAVGQGSSHHRKVSPSWRSKNSSRPLLEVTKVFFLPRRLSKSAAEAVFRVPELTSARSWLSWCFWNGFLLQKAAILASKNVFFGVFLMVSWGLFWALVFDSFSL